MWAYSKADEMVCPSCGAWSRGLHSRYDRCLADLPAGGQQVLLRLRMRRLFCDNVDCSVRTFAEQVGGLTAKRAPHDVMPPGGGAHRVGGGEAGSRLATKLRIRASRPRWSGSTNPLSSHNPSAKHNLSQLT